MAFYLKPPRGIVPLYLLQKCVEARLKFFRYLSETEGPPYLFKLDSVEYIFEDSAYDRAGHFTLRLAAVHDFQFRHFFIKNEVLLFQLRLDTYKDTASLHRFLTTSFRHTTECVREIDSNSRVLQLLKTFEMVFTKILNKSFRLHLLDNINQEEQDPNHIFSVPFEHCITLLPKYTYVLSKGYLKIPYNNWKILLQSLYETYLQRVLWEMFYSSGVHRALEDSRIQLVLSELSNYGFFQRRTCFLSGTEVQIKYFPLCMQNLHGILQKKHRLAHDERLNMSLFLKDIGMSLNDSILYWQSEYSQHSSCTTCLHNWQKDEKRYIYSIRHIYGLEGSRRNYSSKSCQSFQNMNLTPLQEGGCPFKHFDSDKLQLLMTHTFSLSNISYDNCDNILLERSKDPTNACKMFSDTLKFAFNKAELVCDISFRSPVQYYEMMKSL